MVVVASGAAPVPAAGAALTGPVPTTLLPPLPPQPTTTTTVAPTSTTRPVNVCAINPANGEAAITAAIAACPDGTIVRFPAGRVYHQSHEIVVRNRTNLAIDANGSRFVNLAPNDNQLNPNWMLVDNTNLTFYGAVVEGNFKLSGPRSLERAQQVYPGNVQFNAGVAVYGGNGIVVRDSTILDTNGDGVTAAPSGILPGGKGPGHGHPRDVRFQRLTVTRTLRHGAAFTGGADIWLEDSTFRDQWYMGVDVEIDVPGQDMTDVHILRNTFDGLFFSAVAVPWPGDGTDVHRVEIRGNRMLQAPDNCGPAVSINSDPLSLLPVHGIVTEDNQLLTKSRGVLYRAVASGSIRGNRIEKVEPFACGDPEEAPAVLVFSPTVVVEGNTAVGY